MSAILVNLLDLAVVVMLTLSLFSLRKLQIEFDGLPRSLLIWFLGALLATAVLALLRRNLPADYLLSASLFDTVIDLVHYAGAIFFLLFIHAYGQWRSSQAIAHQQQEYQALLANLPGVAYRSSGDEQAVLLQINDGIIDLLGVPANYFRDGHNRSLLEFMYPDDLATMQSTYLDCVRDLKPFTFEYRLRTRKGQQIWVVDRGQPIAGPDGRAAYVDGILLDATRMISAEQALSEREERMQAQQKAVLSLCEFSGSLEQSIQLVTRLMAETLNVSRASVWLYDQEKTNVDCLDVYCLESQSHLDTETLRVADYPEYFGYIEQGEVLAVTQAQTDVKTAELKQPYLLAKNIQSLMDTPIKVGGEVRGLLSAEQCHRQRRWSIDERNFARSVSNIVSLLLEISVNRQIEHDLRRERDRAQSYLDTVNVIIVSIDNSGHVKLVNNRACELMGFTQEEFIGKHWINTFIPEEDRPGLDKAVTRSITGSTEGSLQASHENRVLTKTGDKLLIRWNNAWQTDDEGNVIGILGAGEDITELTRQREEKERLQEEMQHVQKIRSIVQLTGGIAHDFNNMLTSIMGYADLAQISIKRNAEVDSDRYLGAIRATSKKAGKLVSQLLDYSRENVLVKEPFDLNELITDSRRMLEALVSSSIQLVTELDDDIPTISANRSQLQQALVNLCQNSREALRTNDATIWLRTRNRKVLNATCSSCFQKTSGRFVCLEVADNGSGIDGTLLDTLFDPFTTTKEVGEGTGLGLSAVHGIVHMHGGHILVHSEPGKQTRVSILLPANEDRPSADDVAPALQPETPPASVNERPRVLLVDDDESVTRLLANYLQRNGIESKVMNNSKSAWDLFARQSDAFDIVITDQTMPNLTGLELAQKIRTVRPDIPVVLCSGYQEMVDENEATAMGVSRYLNKPVKLENLTSVISELTKE
ncbi:MAG: PAS domain S-box protein [Pseudohongiellaceae bacterium]